MKRYVCNKVKVNMTRPHIICFQLLLPLGKAKKYGDSKISVAVGYWVRNRDGQVAQEF